MNHVEVVGTCSLHKEAECAAAVKERLNIPTIPTNYQHFHLHVFHAKRYSATPLRSKIKT